jgi:hypothetical protein
MKGIERTRFLILAFLALDTGLLSSKESRRGHGQTLASAHGP